MTQDKYLIEPDFADAAKILRGYKNKYEGRRCFIIGNGPSLKPEDLDKIHANGDFSIASNRIFLIFDKTEWRPNIYTSRDTAGLKPSIDLISEIESELKLLLLMPRQKMLPVRNAVPLRELPTNNMWLITRSMTPFSDDITRGVYLTNTITYVNMQIAVYLGFKEIYLIGIDHQYAKMWHVPDKFRNYDVRANKDNFKDGQVINFAPEIQVVEGIQNHFCADYMEGVHEIGEKATAYAIDEATLSYQSAKQYAQAHSIKIKNATRGGKLNVFPRVNFDSLFPKK